MSDFDYAKLTTAERWQWHAEVYAFRRVVLGASNDEYTSPCDPDGKWFDNTLVTEAERLLRKKHKPRKSQDDVWEARDVENKWAQDRGYNDFENYKASERLDHAEACRRLILSMPGPKTIPRAAGGKLADPHAVAAALGIKAREYTSDELRAGRIALGLEQPEAVG